MKTSNIKPSYSLEQTRELPAIAEEMVPESLKQLSEGHFSQAFSYETKGGDKRALRLGRKLYSFEADKYAHEHFSSVEVPIPQVLEIGEVEPGLYYCISQFAEGKPSDQLPEEDFHQARPAMEKVFVQIFRTDISATSGAGNIDTKTGNGINSSYQEALRKEMAGYDLKYLREQSAQNDIDPGLVDAFARQFEENIQKSQAERRLIHGDLGFDNFLIKDNSVTAVIDWSSICYGDWLHDYSRLEFWHPRRHTPASVFAEKHDLDTQNFDARLLTHMANHAIAAINFTFRYESHSTIDWLHKHLASRLGPGNT